MRSSVIGGCLICDQYRGKREGVSPSVVPLSELDFFGGRFSGAILRGGDRLQDLQDLSAVVARAEQGESEFAGHVRIWDCGLWLGVFKGAPAPIVSGDRVGGFHAHFAGVHLSVVVFFPQVLQVGVSSGKAIEQAEGLKDLTLIVNSSDHGVHFGGHRSVACELREVYRVGGGGRMPPCASASVGIEALEVFHKLPCLIATHVADHLTGNSLPGIEVCQVVDRAACFGGGEAGCGGHGVVWCELRSV